MTNEHPIASYRRELGWSRARLAEELGVTRTALYRWEMGQRSIDRDLWVSISAKTGIPVSKLAGIDLLEAAASLEAAQ